MIEGRDCTIYTDHKLLVYAFRQYSERASPWQVRQLSFTAEFCTTVENITGAANTVADALSRIEGIDHQQGHRLMVVVVVQCQRCKVYRHNRAAPNSFDVPDARFQQQSQHRRLVQRHSLKSKTNDWGQRGTFIESTDNSICASGTRLQRNHEACSNQHPAANIDYNTKWTTCAASGSIPELAISFLVHQSAVLTTAGEKCGDHPVR